MVQMNREMRKQKEREYHQRITLEPNAANIGVKTVVTRQDVARGEIRRAVEDVQLAREFEAAIREVWE